MTSSGTVVLSSLGTAQTWVLVLVTAALGILGGLAQYAVARGTPDAAGPAWTAAIVGIVAALGALWMSTPVTAIAQIGQSLLAGFFGRALLATLQARVLAALEKEKRDRAVAIAKDSLALVERDQRPLLTGNGANDREAALHVPRLEVAALRARLADVEALD